MANKVAAVRDCRTPTARAAVPDRSVQCHDDCHSAADPLRGFLFVGLDAASRVSSDRYVVHHPAE